MHNEEPHNLYSLPILLGWANQGGWDGSCSMHGRWEMHIKFWSTNLKGRDHLEDIHRWEDSIKMYLREKRWGGCELDSSGSQ